MDSNVGLSKTLTIFTLCGLLISGCAATPESVIKKAEQSSRVSALASTSKMQSVASAKIGVPQQFVDEQTGTTLRLVVESEYFSANGRTCRRFKEQVSGQERSGVGCNDDRLGWVEIPIASFVQ